MKLKILSWNIWFDGYFDQISALIQKVNPDIIGLQEVASNDKTRDIIGFLSKNGYEHVYTTAFEVREDGRKIGNAIFSKYAILASQTYSLSDKESRKAVRADIQVGNTRLHIFSTHLLHTHQKPSEIQKLQVENLLKEVPLEYSIVMGDFNATPESATIQTISNVLVNTDPSNQPTWSVYPAGCPVCNPTFVNTRLDYIFTTKDIKLNSFQVLDSKGSDHLPTSVIIEL